MENPSSVGFLFLHFGLGCKAAQSLWLLLDVISHLTFCRCFFFLGSLLVLESGFLMILLGFLEGFCYWVQGIGVCLALL